MRSRARMSASRSSGGDRALGRSRSRPPAPAAARRVRLARSNRARVGDERRVAALAHVSDDGARRRLDVLRDLALRREQRREARLELRLGRVEADRHCGQAGVARRERRRPGRPEVGQLHLQHFHGRAGSLAPPAKSSTTSPEGASPGSKRTARSSSTVSPASPVDAERLHLIARARNAAPSAGAGIRACAASRRLPPPRRSGSSPSTKCFSRGSQLMSSTLQHRVLHVRREDRRDLPRRARSGAGGRRPAWLARHWS